MGAYEVCRDNQFRLRIPGMDAIILELV
jgi:hypothetical protein